MLTLLVLDSVVPSSVSVVEQVPSTVAPFSVGPSGTWYDGIVMFIVMVPDHWSLGPGAVVALAPLVPLTRCARLPEAAYTRIAASTASSAFLCAFIATILSRPGASVLPALRIRKSLAAWVREVIRSIAEAHASAWRYSRRHLLWKRTRSPVQHRPDELLRSRGV
jgi:hypothetical protein